MVAIPALDRCTAASIASSRKRFFICPSSMVTARWHHEVMADEDEKAAAPSEETIDVNRSAAAEVSSNPLIVLNETSLALANPETLVRGLRYLQQRIPEFEQL